MPKIIQIIDVDSLGHKVRLDDGRTVFLHYTGRDMSIGSEVEDSICTTPNTVAPSLEFLNSDEQVQANILSEVVTHVNTDDGTEHGAESIENASSEPSAKTGDGNSGAQSVKAKPAK